MSRRIGAAAEIVIAAAVLLSGTSVIANMSPSPQARQWGHYRSVAAMSSSPESPVRTPALQQSQSGSALQDATTGPSPQAAGEDTGATDVRYLNYSRIEGHLPLESSPSAAFSPDGAQLAIVSGRKVLIMGLQNGSPGKSFSPEIPNLRDLDIQSANFLSAGKLFLLGNGEVHFRGEHVAGTPLLGFEWDIAQNTVVGNLSAFGAKPGYGRPRYLAAIGYVGMYKQGAFVLWNPRTRKAAEIPIPELTREPQIYSFSPDGHWLLLAQIAGSGSPNPVVVRLSEHQFVDNLAGHHGAVLSVEFSRDSKKVVTACEDGKVRIWSVGDWKLLATLSGHQGPVRWAEFSPDGSLVVSGGDDHTVRIWSAANGHLIDALRESHAPIMTVAFSPDANYIAASTEHDVLIWKRQ